MLRAQEFDNFDKYIDAVRIFHEDYNQEAPPGPSRSEVILEYLNEKIIDAIEWFISKYERMLQFNQQLSNEKVKSLQKQIEELKKKQSQQQDNYEDQLRALSIEKANQMATINSLQEKMKSDHTFLTQNIKEIKEKYKKEKIEMEQKLVSMKEKMEEHKK